jgi:hypothetical protein
MLDAFLVHPFSLNRHRQAPLLKKRESFLNHLQQQGTSRKALRNLSGELPPVVRLLKLTEMRDVSLEEIPRAARCWARQQRTTPKAHFYGNSASSYIYAAKKWLRFHGRLELPSTPPMRFADQLRDCMTEEHGLSPMLQAFRTLSGSAAIAELLGLFRRAEGTFSHVKRY